MNIQETKYVLSHENDKDPLLEHSSYGKFIILDLRKIPYLQMNDECGLFGHAEDKNITDRNQFFPLIERALGIEAAAIRCITFVSSMKSWQE